MQPPFPKIFGTGVEEESPGDDVAWPDRSRASEAGCPLLHERGQPFPKVRGSALTDDALTLPLQLRPQLREQGGVHEGLRAAEGRAGTLR